MQRRRYLALAGASLAGLAGCFSNGDPASTPEPTDGNGRSDSSPTPTATDAESTALTATATSLQPGVVEMTSPDSIGVRGADGSQYLYLAVSVESGEPPALGDLQVRFDGSTYTSREDLQGLWRYYQDREGGYGGESGEGWLLFELPESGDASDVALTWEGGETRIDDAVAGSLSDRLAEPAPAMSLDLEIPESIERGQTPEIDLSVTNDGERTGHFLAGLNRSGPSIAYTPIQAVSRAIDPGGTDTWRVEDTVRIANPGTDALGDGEPDMTYHVDWLGGSHSSGVRLQAHGRD